MYVCLCHAITDADIAQAANAGATSVDDLSATLGVATGCGSCAETAQDLLNQANSGSLAARQSVAQPAGMVHRYVPSPA
ncbi:MAG: (2Fe-2S)-binding protein [Pseudomonadota bacterium]